MNLLLLGATGRVGSQVLKKSVQAGHRVTAFVRNPEKINLHHTNLQIFQGDARNKEDIEQAMKGMDVVISALSTDGGTTLTDSMPLIIDAMKKENISRIVTVGTAGILQSRSTPSLLRYQSSESKRALTRAAEEHHKAFAMLANSDLDWTVVCPTYLPDGEPLGEYRVERNFLPEGATKISVSDTADFVYEQITSNEFVRTRVGIGY